jgi:hypothetical protein
MDGGPEAELVVEARRKRRWPFVALGLAVVLVASGVAYASTTDAWPGHDVEWDPEIVPLARFVENERGGRFSEPVEIVFNSREEYADQFAIDRDQIDDDDKAELERSLGTLRALGWVAGDLDLLDSAETLGDSGTLGFYLPEDHKIHVRGKRKAFDTAMKVTLVHELTHAYDFAHFDLDLDEDRKMTSGESFGYKSVVEGSAKLTEWAYVESLPEPVRAAAYPDGEGGPDADPQDAADEAALDALPDVFLESMGLPYALGPRFLQGLAARKGADATSPRRGIDAALRRWPRSEEEVVDLDAYEAKAGPKRVAPPAVHPGDVRTDQKDDSVDFGQLNLALLLAPHVGGDVAWRSVQGWAGDSTLNYRRGGKDGPHCLRIAVAFDNPVETSTFRSAAESWRQAIPGATAAVEDGMAVLDTCDPGPDGPPVPEPAGASVTEVVVARGDLLAGLVSQGIPAPAATCLRDEVLQQMGVERFLELDQRLVADPKDADANAAVQAAFASAGRNCGLGG